MSVKILAIVIVSQFFLNNISAQSEKYTFPIGIHRPNLSWAGSLEKELEIIEKMRIMGARSVRLNPNSKAEADFVQHVLHANRLGFKVNFEVSLAFPEFYHPNAQRRAKKKHWDPRYQLSDIKPVNVQVWAANMFKELKAKGAVIEVVEVGNEFNWIDFNGDMPEIAGGKYYDYDSDWEDPDYVKIRKGLDLYGQILKIIRKEAEKTWGKGGVKVVSGGLVRHMSLGTWFKNHDATILAPQVCLDILQGTHPRQTKATNYLKYADGIGIHFYPVVAELDLEKAKKSLGDEIRLTMDALVRVAGNNRKFWVTEWGFARHKKEFKTEEERFIVAENFLNVCKTLPYNWGTMYFFTFDGQKIHRAYEDGNYLSVSKIFK
ncbi:hypothetical protein SAMN04487898_1019 [Pedobacter sp. ok626]|uniref:hypothetical protein n=1 Tax=Pedobacter sp. ok626 TaxID=1761882 RepID=UPI000881986B|nr:hypothetical protein [Pedobacter sp. ok626]SDI98705.1 hypothetical protein SAMN04487898_1019 [Pedobacter sp. ok626]